MKNQALFSSEDKIKKIKCRLLQLLFGTSRVKLLLQLRTGRSLIMKGDCFSLVSLKLGPCCPTCLI